MAAAAAAAAPREKVAFPFNVAQFVTLEGRGIEQASNDGTPEYRYKLADDRIMWVPAEAHRQIEMSNGQRGSEYSITRAKQGKAAATWIVEQIEDEPPAARDLAQHQPAPISAPRPQPTPAPQKGTHERTAQGWTYREPPTPATPEPEPPTSASMYAALCAAIRTAAAAETFAQQLGRPLAFSTADVRAIAATLFIHQQEVK